MHRIDALLDFRVLLNELCVYVSFKAMFSVSLNFTAYAFLRHLFCMDRDQNG